MKRNGDTIFERRGGKLNRFRTRRDHLSCRCFPRLHIGPLVSVSAGRQSKNQFRGTASLQVDRVLLARFAQATSQNTRSVDHGCGVRFQAM